jgi:hypothetical protein
VKVAIQRRNVFLTPPMGMDLLWVSQQFVHPDVVDMFALGDDLRGWHVRSGHRLGTVVLGMIRRVSDGRRVGFTCAAAPTPTRACWELLGAIPDVRHRDGYTMLHAVDTLTHYLFDHLHIPLLGARMRMDNRAPQALTERAGYRRGPVETWDGVEHVSYSCDEATWVARRRRLERGERDHPSGAGGAFVVLPGPPYVPVIPGAGSA